MLVQVFVQVLTSFSVYRTFHYIIELRTRPEFWFACFFCFFNPILFCILGSFSLFFPRVPRSFLCFYIPRSLFAAQCRLATNTSPAPTSFCGRRGPPPCKASSSIPPIWAAGHWTSTTYSTHAAVRIYTHTYIYSTPTKTEYIFIPVVAILHV